MSKITVIGSLVMDMVASVDEFPQPGQTIIGKKLGIYPGGKGANQCVAISRLGGDVEMIGMVGNDGYGQTFRKLLSEEKIKIDNLFETQLPTSIAQIQINNLGENKIVVVPSANYEFNLDNLKQVENIVAKTSLVVMQLELRLEVSLAIIKMCNRLNIPIILNPAPAVPLSNDILASVDYITPNETELQILTGMPTTTDEEVYAAAEKLLTIGVKTVIATLGSRGALLADKDGKRIIQGYKVKVVDTVAAGDSFNGALAKCIVEGKTLDEAVRFANAVGALTVTRSGAIPSLARLDEVKEFIQKHS